MALHRTILRIYIEMFDGYEPHSHTQAPISAHIPTPNRMHLFPTSTHQDSQAGCAFPNIRTYISSFKDGDSVSGF